MPVYFDLQTETIRTSPRIRARAAAMFSGDDGMDVAFTKPPFVPPWTQAPRRSNYTIDQGQVTSAQPSYNAGPQVGAIKSQPNFVGNDPQLLKNSPGTLFSFIVNAAGSAAGGIYDANSLQGIQAANLICTIPMTVGIYVLEWPCQLGIVIAPGAGQVVSAKWV